MRNVLALVLAFYFVAVSCDNIVVVHTEDEDSMILVQKRINEHFDTTSSPFRHPLSALETTMSRVVDSEHVEIARQDSTPMFHLESMTLEGDADPTMHIKYLVRKTIAYNDLLVDYERVLYFSKKDTTDIMIGDVNNICLQRDVGTQICFNRLKDQYYINSDLTAPVDLVDFTVMGVTVEVSPAESFSQLQEVLIKVPLSSLQSHLATSTVFTHPTRGPIQQYIFAIGMMFFPSHESASRIILYDVFHFEKDTTQIISFKKSTSYSIAQYVSFWTSSVFNKNIKVATVEFTVEAAHTVEELKFFINGNEVTSQMCDTMSQRIASELDNSECILPNSATLCQFQAMTSDSLKFVTNLLIKKFLKV